MNNVKIVPITIILSHALRPSVFKFFKRFQPPKHLGVGVYPPSRNDLAVAGRASLRFNFWIPHPLPGVHPPRRNDLAVVGRASSVDSTSQPESTLNPPNPTPVFTLKTKQIQQIQVSSASSSLFSLCLNYSTMPAPVPLIPHGVYPPRRAFRIPHSDFNRPSNSHPVSHPIKKNPPSASIGGFASLCPHGIKVWKQVPQDPETSGAEARTLQRIVRRDARMLRDHRLEAGATSARCLVSAAAERLLDD